MKNLTPILSISGSDSTGQSGIQADIKTIAALGGYAVTAVSSIAVQNSRGVEEIYDVSADVVISQVASIMEDVHPRAVKVGLVRDAETIRRLRSEVIGSRRLVVTAGIFASDGSSLMTDEAIHSVKTYLIPSADLLMLRCRDAEILLGMKIATDDDMLLAAKRFHEMGAEWILLRGGQISEGRLTALLYGEESQQFFSSYNTEGWQRHGVGGALSAAVTTRLGMGDSVPEAIRNAHRFIHSQVVYAKDMDEGKQRPADLYNEFVSLVAGHYSVAHDVSFYADKLCISTRYLSQITRKVAGKTPKQIIANYIILEANKYLDNTRLTIQEISDKLGFSSQVMFCKFFKNQYGMTPTEHRNLPPF